MGRVVAKRVNCKLGFFSLSLGLLVWVRVVVVVVCVLHVCVDVDVVSKAALGVLAVLAVLGLLGVRCPSPRHATHTGTHCASSSLFFGSTPSMPASSARGQSQASKGKGRDETSGKGRGAER